MVVQVPAGSLPGPLPGAHRAETPAPCLCPGARRPAQPAQVCSRLQLLWSAPRSSRGCLPGRPAWAVCGLAGLPSGLPEQQDPSVSLAGLTGQVGASGGPHTTVLTEGSERLSGPVISVGWYCCKIEIQTRQPLARARGRARGRDWRARPGGGRGAPGLCVARPSGSLRGGGGRAGRASQLSLWRAHICSWPSSLSIARRGSTVSFCFCKAPRPPPVLYK